MPGTRWIRILLAGLIAGTVWYLLSSVFLSTFAQPFLAWARITASKARWSGALFFAIDLAMGVWAVWLYSSLSAARSRTTAAITVGFAWWILKTLQSAKWAGLGLIPGELILAPLVTSLAATVVASLVGGLLYDGLRKWREGRMPAAPDTVS